MLIAWDLPAPYGFVRRLLLSAFESAKDRRVRAGFRYGPAVANQSMSLSDQNLIPAYVRRMEPIVTGDQIESEAVSEVQPAQMAKGANPC